MKTNSNYHISSAKIGGRKIIYTEHIGQKTRFSIIPVYGACLNDLMIQGRPILWSARSEEELTQRTIGAFSGAQLFPFPNRVKNLHYLSTISQEPTYCMDWYTTVHSIRAFWIKRTARDPLATTIEVTTLVFHLMRI